MCDRSGWTLPAIHQPLCLIGIKFLSINPSVISRNIQQLKNMLEVSVTLIRQIGRCLRSSRSEKQPSVTMLCVTERSWNCPHLQTGKSQAAMCHNVNTVRSASSSLQVHPGVTQLCDTGSSTSEEGMWQLWRWYHRPRNRLCTRCRDNDT